MDLKLQIYNQETSKLLPIEVLKFIRTLDIYYQPEFLACDAKMQNGTYEIAVYTSGSNIWVYPYIVLPIKETAYFDISSPYGYAGPVATSNEIQPEAEQLFVDYIRSKQNIATEFVRYHHIYNENKKKLYYLCDSCYEDKMEGRVSSICDIELLALYQIEL